MKSTVQQLKSRGFATPGEEIAFNYLDFTGLRLLNKSDDAAVRTIAARLLGMINSDESVQLLCEALKTEKKLYTKIEISESLGKIGITALPQLSQLIAKIGYNQYKEPPILDFRKKSYPLPRDIVIRTIIRMGKDALPFLESLLESDDQSVISEVIDAIGFISFYSGESRSVAALKECYLHYFDNELIIWKIVRAFSAFPNELAFLQKMMEDQTNQRIVDEVERSISLIFK